MKSFDITVRVSFEDELVDYDELDALKEELEDSTKTLLEYYIADEIVGYSNKDKYSVKIN
jgi:predicted RNA-binding protein associated with RNAse of E/G family